MTKHLDKIFKTCFIILIYLFFLSVSHGMWDLNSWTRDQTGAPCTGSKESQDLKNGETHGCHFVQ